VHVATWIEAATRELAAASVKQRLAAVRHLFDWLVTGPAITASKNTAGGVPNQSTGNASGVACWTSLPTLLVVFKMENPGLTA
jgi:hypothetical protein